MGVATHVTAEIAAVAGAAVIATRLQSIASTISNLSKLGNVFVI
jgi:hypothetical protein